MFDTPLYLIINPTLSASFPQEWKQVESASQVTFTQDYTAAFYASIAVCVASH